MIMRVKKIVSIFLVFLFVVCSVSALSIEFGSSGDGGTRSPDVTKRRDDDLVGVINRHCSTVVSKTPVNSGSVIADHLSQLRHIESQFRELCFQF